MKNNTVRACACGVCGHVWEPRKLEKPKRCSSCKSPYWEDGNPNSDIIRAKWTFDGAETLSEAAQMLENEAKRLRKMEAEGWQLTQEIADDYGFVEKTKRRIK